MQTMFASPVRCAEGVSPSPSTQILYYCNELRNRAQLAQPVTINLDTLKSKYANLNSVRIISFCIINCGINNFKMFECACVINIV